MITADHPQLGVWRLECEGSPRLLFTENETNNRRIFGTTNDTAFVKDGINDFVVDGSTAAINPEKTGTKAAAYYLLDIPAGSCAIVRLRLRRAELDTPAFDASFDEIFARRRTEADAFYDAITPTHLDVDGRSIFRQALAGMLWSKQHYHYDVARWLEEHRVCPLSRGSIAIRNADWVHLLNDHLISMPDKWEYPWYASWDLGFHCVALVLVDPEFAKQQLELLVHSATCTRMASSLPTNGHSATSIRRFSRGRPSLSMKLIRCGTVASAIPNSLGTCSKS